MISVYNYWDIGTSSVVYIFQKGIIFLKAIKYR